MGSFNLNKGERFSLTKAAPGLARVRIGLGWDPNEKPGGPAFDLDVSAFAIAVNHKIVSDSHFVFYNQINVVGRWVFDKEYPTLKRPISDDKAIIGAIDDPDGTKSDGDDDEDMIIDLPKVSPLVEQIIICATICKYPHDRNSDRRTLQLGFGQVGDCYIRIVDMNNGQELARYALGEKFSDEDAVEFGRLYRVSGAWEFEAMGRGSQGSLPALVEFYT